MDKQRNFQMKDKCYKCGERHFMRDCPELQNETVICYKCGSSEHILKNCKAKTEGNANYTFAKCHVCGEMGHIASKCVKNPNGIYRFGGECRNCSSKFHLWRDCPKLTDNKKESVKKPRETTKGDSDKRAAKPKQKKVAF